MSEPTTTEDDRSELSITGTVEITYEKSAPVASLRAGVQDVQKSVQNGDLELTMSGVPAASSLGQSAACWVRIEGVDLEDLPEGTQQVVQQRIRDVIETASYETENSVSGFVWASDEDVVVNRWGVTRQPGETWADQMCPICGNQGKIKKTSPGYTPGGRSTGRCLECRSWLTLMDTRGE